jgi:hypothetical protein
MSSMEVVEGLRAVRARIATPGQWTQGPFARNACGEARAAHDPGAVCFCLAGANMREHPGDLKTYLAIDSALDRQASRLGLDSYVWFNDESGRTHAEVLAFIDDAISHELAKVRCVHAPDTDLPLGQPLAL